MPPASTKTASLSPSETILVRNTAIDCTIDFWIATITLAATDALIIHSYPGVAAPAKQVLAPPTGLGYRKQHEQATKSLHAYTLMREPRSERTMRNKKEIETKSQRETDTETETERQRDRD